MSSTSTRRKKSSRREIIAKCTSWPLRSNLLLVISQSKRTHLSQVLLSFTLWRSPIFMKMWSCCSKMKTLIKSGSIKSKQHLERSKLKSNIWSIVCSLKEKTAKILVDHPQDLRNRSPWWKIMQSKNSPREICRSWVASVDPVKNHSDQKSMSRRFSQTTLSQ